MKKEPFSRTLLRETVMRHLETLSGELDVTIVNVRIDSLIEPYQATAEVRFTILKETPIGT